MSRKPRPTEVYLFPRDPDKVPLLLLEAYTLEQVQGIVDITYGLLGDFLRSEATSPREIN